MADKKDTLDDYILRGKREIASHEDVFLDRMDGYQFQKFIASLFQRLGFSNVRVGPAGADEGIDIEMVQATDVGNIRYVVECKHHAEGIIGRPVIQKLHSAIITKAMNKGIVVTTGYFSSDAVEYAENIGIELIDIDKLRQLAKKVGLAVHEESSLLIDNCFPFSEEPQIIASLRSFLENHLIGFHTDLAQIEELNLSLLSAYMIDYTINATFSTSAGVIHSIYESSSSFFKGEDGTLIEPKITSPFVSIARRLTVVGEKEITVKIVKKGEFAKRFAEVKENAIEALRQLYTKTVSYYGRNNVRYTKTCTPNKRDIHIRDIRRVYLPIWSIPFSMLKNKYLVIATETLGTLNILSASLADEAGVPTWRSDFKLYPSNCMECYRDLGDGAYVCSECGGIVCKKDKFDCKVCRKAICRKDVIKKRRFLLLTDKYCPKCALSMGIAGASSDLSG